MSETQTRAYICDVSHRALAHSMTIDTVRVRMAYTTNHAMRHLTEARVTWLVGWLAGCRGWLSRRARLAGGVGRVGWIWVLSPPRGGASVRGRKLRRALARVRVAHHQAAEQRARQRQEADRQCSRHLL